MPSDGPAVMKSVPCAQAFGVFWPASFSQCEWWLLPALLTLLDLRRSSVLPAG
jgi:hypothetical protein